MICPQCKKQMEIEHRQVRRGDLTCCGERDGYNNLCKQKGHKNYVCNDCNILSGGVK